MTQTLDAIVDRIYEAALVPELWPDVLDEIAGLSGTIGGILFTTTPGIAVTGKATLGPALRWTSTKSLENFFAAFLREGWMDRNIRGQRGLEIEHAGFVTDQDLCTAEEIETHPFYHFFRQWGFGWATGFCIRVPTGDALIFNWERRFVDGPVDRRTLALLGPLRGHLARSSLVASRLGLERARAAAQALEMLGLPSAVLCGRGRILAANSLLQSLMPAIVTEGSAGRVHLADKKADALLTNALNQVQSAPGWGTPTDTAFSFPTPATEGHAATIVHLVPVRRAARDIFAAAASIVIVTPLSRNDVPSAVIIQGLFDLTPAEARVARRVAAGDTVIDIATASNTSVGTVRNQLKAVFAKTGVSRQGELVGLLGNVDIVRKTF